MSVCGLYVSHVGEGEGVVGGKIIKVELWGAHRGCGWGGRYYAMYAKQLMGV